MQEKDYTNKIQELENRIRLLEKKNELYESILANLPLGIQVFDEAGISYFINKKQGELLGLPDLSVGIGKFNVLNDPFAVKTDASKIFEKGYKGEEFEHTFEYNLGIKENKWDTRKDTRFFNERIIPLVDNNHSIKYVLAILADVTEKKRGEEQIKESEKKKEELNVTKDRIFSIIAHDLRNPFNALIGMNEIVSKMIDSNDPVSAKKILRLIYKTSKQALTLLENLLQWSLIQTGRLEFHPTRLNFIELITCILELLKINYSEKEISIKIIAEPSLYIIADNLMLETIMRNLISNAIKFTNRGGKVEIEATKKGNDIEISVYDNGIGILQNKIEKLFKLESTISTFGTEYEKGTGLGLILCKEFVEQHGGKIWVESKENHGTKFTFTIMQSTTS